MKKATTVRSYEYKNDFLYLVIRQAPELGADTYLFCSGIFISRFDPLCWGKAGICSNPAFKGLQQMRADVSGYALKKGLRTLPSDGNACGPITPGGDGWYRETMVIKGAAPRDIQAIREFAILDLVKTVLYVCAPGVAIPATLPDPGAMQKWLASMGVKDYVAAAPPPIAKPQ